MGRSYVLRIALWQLGVILVLVPLVSPLFGNLWLLATGVAWHVPVESSVFTFSETRANEGSGEWWLAGEDGRNFYAQRSPGDGYVVLSREAAARCAGFDRFDASTWCGAQLRQPSGGGH